MVLRIQAKKKKRKFRVKSRIAVAPPARKVKNLKSQNLESENLKSENLESENLEYGK